MAEKERYQNPVVNDDLTLRLITYNGNNLADLHQIEEVNIYFLDPNAATEDNPDGRTLIDTIGGGAVTTDDTGTYSLQITLESDKYVIGQYYDVWTVVAVEGMPSHEIVQRFDIYPDLWYSTPMPVVYDFDFRFQPNKLRKGSKQYLKVEIIPRVPTAGDLRQYYENLAITSDLAISIKQKCGDCMPAEDDLRLIVDEENVDYREKRFGFYQLDTEEMDCGLYDIWFKLELGGNVYISDRYVFQVYD